MLYRFLLARLPGVDDSFSSGVIEQHGAVFTAIEVPRRYDARIDHRQREPVAEESPELLHEIE